MNTPCQCNNINSELNFQKFTSSWAVSKNNQKFIYIDYRLLTEFEVCFASYWPSLHVAEKRKLVFPPTPTLSKKKVIFCQNTPQYLYSCTLSLAVQIDVGKMQNNIYIYKEADFPLYIICQFYWFYKTGIQ